MFVLFCTICLAYTIFCTINQHFDKKNDVHGIKNSSKIKDKVCVFSAIISGKNPKPVSYGELSTRRDWTENAGKTLFPGKQDQTGLDRSARSTLDFGANTVKRNI